MAFVAKPSEDQRSQRQPAESRRPTSCENRHVQNGRHSVGKGNVETYKRPMSNPMLKVDYFNRPMSNPMENVEFYVATRFVDC
jgi:hypothetical protein